MLLFLSCLARAGFEEKYCAVGECKPTFLASPIFVKKFVLAVLDVTIVTLELCVIDKCVAHCTSNHVNTPLTSYLAHGLCHGLIM